MSEKKSLKVKILDQEYPIIVEDDSIAEEISDYLNSLIDDVKRQLADQPMQTILVTVAMNIAYELVLEKRKNNTSDEILLKSIDKINKLRLLLEQHSEVDPPII